MIEKTCSRDRKAFIKETDIPNAIMSRDTEAELEQSSNHLFTYNYDEETEDLSSLYCPTLLEEESISTNDDEEELPQQTKLTVTLDKVENVAKILLGMKFSVRESTLLKTTEDEKSSSSFQIDNTSFPRYLSLPSDSRELNSLHCFVRANLLEMFTIKGYKLNAEKQNTCAGESISSETSCDDATDSDEDNSEGHSKKGKFPGRIGLRCVACRHIQKKRVHDSRTKSSNDHFFSKRKARMSIFYPKSLEGLYRQVCTWQRVHFQVCPHVPKNVRDKYEKLKSSDKTRGKTKYWPESAREIGLVNAHESISKKGGIHFVTL